MDGMDQLQLAERLVAKATTIVWDFDGVIADTEPVQAASFAAVLEAHGIQPPENFFSKFLGRSEREIWLALRAQYGLRTSVEALTASRSDLYLANASRLSPAPYVAPLLSAAKESGSVSLIVSSGTVDHIEHLLQAFQLQHAFIGIYCIGSPRDVDLSDKASRLQHIASGWSRPQVLLEDNFTYLALGTALQMRAIAVMHSMSPIDLSTHYEICLRH
jgi:phosphoglycolate phosphatase-like HAD superfamily hydrolase